MQKNHRVEEGTVQNKVNMLFKEQLVDWRP